MPDTTRESRELRRTYAVVLELEQALEAIDASIDLPATERRRCIAAILHHRLLAAFDAGAAEVGDLRTALHAREVQLEHLKKSRETLQKQLGTALARLRGGG